MSRKQKPTVEEDNSAFRGKTYSHPAYGMIGLSHIQCNPAMSLFGSNIRHSHLIALRIKTAVKNCNGDYSFFHGKQPLIEVFLSGNQLGDLLTSMNQGDGVPCTIGMRETDWNIPSIEDEETPISESRKSMEAHLKKVMERADALTQETLSLLEEKKSANKGDLAKIVSSLKMLRQEIHSNIPFVAKCFDEKMEKTISHAKGEVDAFVSSTIRSAGLDAIANGNFKLEIPQNENDVRMIEINPKKESE